MINISIEWKKALQSTNQNSDTRKDIKFHEAKRHSSNKSKGE